MTPGPSETSGQPIGTINTTHRSTSEDKDMVNEGFTEAQLAQLRQILADSARNPPQGPPGPPGPPGHDSQNVNNGGNGRPAPFKAEEVGFFDPHLATSFGPGDTVIVGKDVYFQDVHLFLERAKDQSHTKGCGVCLG